MKAIVSALAALSVLVVIAGTTNVLDSTTFWDQQERQPH
jgi:hypothetical protein